MLTLIVPARDFYDEKTTAFVSSPEVTLRLEHSLFALSKWERIWKKPFLSVEKKTSEETMSYIQQMCLDEDVDPSVFSRLNSVDHERIREYLSAKMTAAWFSDSGTRKPSREIVTAEIIYYWMISHNIPFECQYWHLDSLLALIKTCNAKNATGKKMSRSEILAKQRELNMKRRAQLGSKG